MAEVSRTYLQHNQTGKPTGLPEREDHFGVYDDSNLEGDAGEGLGIGIYHRLRLLSDKLPFEKIRTAKQKEERLLSKIEKEIKGLRERHAEEMKQMLVKLGLMRGIDSVGERNFDAVGHVQSVRVEDGLDGRAKNWGRVLVLSTHLYPKRSWGWAGLSSEQRKHIRNLLTRQHEDVVKKIRRIADA